MAAVEIKALELVQTRHIRFGIDVFIRVQIRDFALLIVISGVVTKIASGIRR